MQRYTLELIDYSWSLHIYNQIPGVFATRVYQRIGNVVHLFKFPYDLKVVSDSFLTNFYNLGLAEQGWASYF
jgi:hypothetical protein